MCYRGLVKRCRKIATLFAVLGLAFVAFPPTARTQSANRPPAVEFARKFKLAGNWNAPVCRHGPALHVPAESPILGRVIRAHAEADRPEPEAAADRPVLGEGALPR